MNPEPILSELIRPKPIRIVKLGGSLLDWEGMPEALLAWLAKNEDCENWIVVGGGRAADAIRTRAARETLDDEAAHWLAIEAMRENSTALSKRCDAQFYDVGPFLREEEPRLPGVKLPHNWDVTSDSIAARLAITQRAAELVLLKSTLPKWQASLETLAKVGYVDAFFPPLEPEVPPLRFVDLRTGQQLTANR